MAGSLKHPPLLTSRAMRRQRRKNVRRRRAQISGGLLSGIGPFVQPWIVAGRGPIFSPCILEKVEGLVARFAVTPVSQESPANHTVVTVYRRLLVLGCCRCGSDLRTLFRSDRVAQGAYETLVSSLPIATGQIRPVALGKAMKLICRGWRH